MLENGEFEHLENRELVFFGVDLNDLGISLSAEDRPPFVMPGIELQDPRKLAG